VPQPVNLYYPNRFARYIYQAMHEVMGQNSMQVVLSLAKLEWQRDRWPPDTLAKEFPFASLAAIGLALEEVYGGRGGRGMSLQIGRVAFSQGMRGFGAFAGMGDPAFRALPLDERTHLGLRALAEVYSTFSDQQCAVEEGASSYQFGVQHSPMAWGRTSEKPVCHGIVGTLQECLRWASNGYEFHVYETACHACGSSRCEFTVNKTPIGQRSGE
jgi:predicted hydrocarbon binding protein